MSNETSNPSFVALKNVPTDYGLLQSKDLIKKKLNDDNAVLSIDYDKNSAGEVLRSNIIVELRDALCMNNFQCVILVLILNQIIILSSYLLHKVKLYVTFINEKMIVHMKVIAFKQLGNKC